MTTTRENVTSITRAIDARHVAFSAAFAVIEGEVQDLRTMARIAQLQLFGAVGELSGSEGEFYTETPRVEAVQHAVFLVNQMADMAKAFEDRYFRLWDEARGTA
jgi:hypothetical protein